MSNIRRRRGPAVQLHPEPDLFPGDWVHVEGSYEGGKMHYFEGRVVSVKPSGTVIVDDSKEADGAGTPIRHYVSSGTIYLRSAVPTGPLVVDPNEGREHA